jgi:hypothetical protein
MISDAKNTTIDRLSHRGLLTAADTSPGVDNAIEALNGALASLGNLKVQCDQALIPDADVLTLEETRECIECQYISLTKAWYMPLTGFPDSRFLWANIGRISRPTN